MQQSQLRLEVGGGNRPNGATRLEAASDKGEEKPTLGRQIKLSPRVGKKIITYFFVSKI